MLLELLTRPDFDLGSILHCRGFEHAHASICALVYALAPGQQPQLHRRALGATRFRNTCLGRWHAPTPRISRVCTQDSEAITASFHKYKRALSGELTRQHAFENRTVPPIAKLSATVL